MELEFRREPAWRHPCLLRRRRNERTVHITVELWHRRLHGPDLLVAKRCGNQWRRTIRHPVATPATHAHTLLDLRGERRRREQRQHLHHAIEYGQRPNQRSSAGVQRQQYAMDDT